LVVVSVAVALVLMEIGMADYTGAFIYLMSLEDSTGRGLITNDDGGRTRWGISEKWSGSLPSDYYEMTAFDSRVYASQWYKRVYWDRMLGDQITSNKLAAQVFSIGVNVALDTAITLLQRCLHIPDDGVMGPKTLNALNAADQITTLAAFNASALKRYASIVLVKPELQKYLSGWQNRVNAIYHFPIMLEKVS
jgi:lysozyme family protein